MTRAYGAHSFISREYDVLDDDTIEVEFRVEGTISPGEKPSWSGPGEPAEFEVDTITCEGREVNIELTEQEEESCYMDACDKLIDEKHAQEEDAYDARNDR